MTVSDDLRTERSTVDTGSSPIEDRPSSGGDRHSAGANGSKADEDQSAVTIYRWACPICGESRTGMASGEENPRSKAEFSLRQHVKTSDGDGHGAANAYPPRFDPDAAGRAVSVD